MNNEINRRLIIYLNYVYLNVNKADDKTKMNGLLSTSPSLLILLQEMLHAASKFQHQRLCKTKYNVRPFYFTYINNATLIYHQGLISRVMICDQITLIQIFLSCVSSILMTDLQGYLHVTKLQQIKYRSNIMS